MGWAGCVVGWPWGGRGWPCDGCPYDRSGPPTPSLPSSLEKASSLVTHLGAPWAGLRETSEKTMIYAPKLSTEAGRKLVSPGSARAAGHRLQAPPGGHRAQHRLEEQLLARVHPGPSEPPLTHTHAEDDRKCIWDLQRGRGSWSSRQEALRARKSRGQSTHREPLPLGAGPLAEPLPKGNQSAMRSGWNHSGLDRDVPAKAKHVSVQQELSGQPPHRRPTCRLPSLRAIRSMGPHQGWGLSVLSGNRGARAGVGERQVEQSLEAGLTSASQ